MDMNALTKRLLIAALAVIVLPLAVYTLRTGTKAHDVATAAATFAI